MTNPNPVATSPHPPESEKEAVLRDALTCAIRVANEARDEWDAAPSGMKAGKLLIALSGHLPGYREDIDAIHAAVARETSVAATNPESCAHMDFAVEARIARLEDCGRFMAEIRIKCSQCGLPFEFQGLQPGLNLNGAAMSVDAQEANLAIAPHGSKPTPLDVIGYQIRGLQS